MSEFSDSAPFFIREQLALHMEKLSANPGGVLVVTVEIFPGMADCPAVGFVVLNQEERAALKRSLGAVSEPR